MRCPEQSIGVQIIRSMISRVRYSLQTAALRKNAVARRTSSSVQPTTKTDNMSIYAGSWATEKCHKGAAKCVALSRALTCKLFAARYQGHVTHFKWWCRGKTRVQDKKFHANETQKNVAYYTQIEQDGRRQVAYNWLSFWNSWMAYQATFVNNLIRRCIAIAQRRGLTQRYLHLGELPEFMKSLPDNRRQWPNSAVYSDAPNKMTCTLVPTTI